MEDLFTILRKLERVQVIIIVIILFIFAVIVVVLGGEITSTEDLELEELASANKVLLLLLSLF